MTRFSLNQDCINRWTHRSVDNGLCRMQSEAPGSTARMPEKGVAHAARMDRVWAWEGHHHPARLLSREMMLKSG